MVLTQCRLSIKHTRIEFPLAMLSDASQIIVLVLGLAVLVLSAWGIVNPDNLMKSVTSVLDQKWGLYFGIIVRLILGAALIIAAPNSSFPLVFGALGWVAILAALVLAVMGRRNIQKLIAWFEQLPTRMIRVWLLFGMAFGGFLIVGIL